MDGWADGAGAPFGPPPLFSTLLLNGTLPSVSLAICAALTAGLSVRAAARVGPTTIPCPTPAPDGTTFICGFVAPGATAWRSGCSGAGLAGVGCVLGGVA